MVAGEIKIRGKPSGFYKFFSRIPAYLYRLGFSKPFEANTLVLSTKGRKSGKIIKFPLGYARKKNVIYIASVYQDPDWYKNVLTYPEVGIQIGKEHLKTKASIVVDLDEKAKAYTAIVRGQGEKSAERFYYITPGMNDEEIGAIGKDLQILRLEISD